MDTIPTDETHDHNTDASTVHKTVYYLTHRDSGDRRGYYQSRAGARIAQRARNSHLGFRDRIERVEQFANWEVELCRLKDGTILEATWVIVEDSIEITELRTP